MEEESERMSTVFSAGRVMLGFGGVEEKEKLELLFVATERGDEGDCLRLGMVLCEEEKRAVSSCLGR